MDFGYVPEKMVLHDVTLYAKPGQKIAFVGATGAGKTTITNLINRFYDIEDGKIRYDGININKIKKADLRRSLGIVLQTMLTGDGSNLSQGQKQLLSIARVAVADPPVLILDEATSSIDTRTEYLVQRGMDTRNSSKRKGSIISCTPAPSNSNKTALFCVILRQSPPTRRVTYDLVRSSCVGGFFLV